MVVGLVIASWILVVTVLCAAVRQATRVPWWEEILLDLDALDVAERPAFTPQDQAV